MGYGVLIHRSDSIYNDSPAERYQFPSQYLGRVQACVGDWIIYYEPRKVADTRGYFAIAKVQQVIPDPATAGMYLALIEPGSCLDFATPVPFTDASGVVNERGVLNEEGRISGRAQSAVRPISPSDFNRIIALGLNDSEPMLPRVGEAPPMLDLQEEQRPFEFEQSRDRTSFTVSRIVRDRIFRRTVLRAYPERCAVSGLKLINGRGRAEVAAAHIRPVEAHGPDIVSNGIALSGTVHWMFDRGLISLADDLQILVSRQANDPDSIRALINKSGYAFAPQRTSERPHPHFLQWHREHCFKQ
ncbi:restriction endonuclease [Pseudolabrys taiwanensis]|uniref:Restriction endonuclease n=1 Tax=Pseudolabrys taiwanensis TaxID=331696 RepID=A0A345ZV17_9HYPH|nr:HNH endonuclease [Pseudolabrys taiwanensis]AXK80764.1 restriction endonuclease [Pseudolabrys taiwanensis]